MAFPVYTVQQLSSATGRPVESYTEWADEAIAQASLLFQFASCLREPLDDPLEDALMRYGVLFLADALYLAQKWQEEAASPYQAETIGAYSYSKLVKKAQDGDATGVEFYDKAVAELGVCNLEDSTRFGYGGIEVFEYDGHFRAGRREGNVEYLSPSQVAMAYQFTYTSPPLVVVSDSGDLSPDPENPGYLTMD